MKAPRLLVVDDEPGIAQLCERILSLAGFDVSSFTSPRQVLDLLQKERADLLLVDIRMPEISGFDVLQLARQYQPEIALLAMTGYGTVETAIQALRRGVDGLLLKPFEKDELVQTVQQALLDNQQKQDVARMMALRPLFSVTESLFAETRPNVLLDLVMGILLRQLACPNASFFQWDARQTKLRLLAERGRPAPLNLVEQTYETQTPLFVAAGLEAEAPLEAALQSAELSGLMVIPVSLADFRCVLLVSRQRGDPPFRKVDLEMFTILARQAAIAMENARLYQELRSYVQRVEESQRALVQAEKLAAVGRMTASIAHEVNNPLQSVRSCLHLVAREDAPPEMRQKYLELTVQEVERLQNTVRRALEFYRPSQEFRPVQVLDVLEHALHLMNSQLRERGIRVTTSWPPGLPPVQAISNQLEQVFINLTLNAFDAMPEGGEFNISIEQKRKWVEIFFRDTGPGIPPEIRKHIFEPFVSSKPTGSGLGLSVSYDIVTAHNGELDYLPAQGPGACFRIRLPISS